MDIAEWPFLRNIVHEDAGQLDTVRQMAMEIHAPRFKRQRTTKEDAMEMVYYASALLAQGFTVFRSSTEFFCCSMMAGMMPRGVTEMCCIETFFLH